MSPTTSLGERGPSSGREGPAGASEIRRRVEARKDAIIGVLRRGGEAEARRLTDELVRMQSANGRGDLAAKSLCDLGKRAERTGSLGFAQHVLDEARRQAPLDRIVWVQLVALARRRARPDEQLALSEEMLARFPDDLVAMTTRASALRTAARFDASLALYERAMERFPGDARVRTGRALVLRRLGRLEESERAYLDALARSPSDEFAWAGVGSAARAKGELERAVRVLRETVARFPACRAAHVYLGETLVSLGRAEEGLRAFDDAGARFREDLRPARGRARALAALGRQSEAMRDAQRFVRRFPSSVLARTIRGEVRTECGAFAGAVEDFEAVQRTQELDVSARVAFALALMQLGDLGRATQLLDEHAKGAALAASAGEWSWSIARGLVALRAGDLDGAEHGLRAATSSPLVEMRARAFHGLALSALVRGDSRAAAAHLAAAPSVEAMMVRTAGAVVGVLAGARAALPGGDRLDAACHEELAKALRACPLRFAAMTALGRSAGALPAAELSGPALDPLVDLLLL